MSPSQYDLFEKYRKLLELATSEFTTAQPSHFDQKWRHKLRLVGNKLPKNVLFWVIFWSRFLDNGSINLKKVYSIEKRVCDIIYDFFGVKYSATIARDLLASVTVLLKSRPVSFRGQQLVQRRTSWQQQTFMLWRRATVSSSMQTQPAWNMPCRLPTLIHLLWKHWSFGNDKQYQAQPFQEVIFSACGTRGKSVHVPPPCQDIDQVRSLRVLGVTVNSRLTANDHVNNLLSLSTNLFYALRIMRCIFVFQHLRCKTSFVQLLLRRSRTVRQRGPVPALRLIAHGLTRFSDAVNDKISAQRTCRQFDDEDEAFSRQLYLPQRIPVG